MSAEIIAEGQVSLKLPAARRANVKMTRRVAQRCRKRFALVDTQISLMTISKISQTLDSQWKKFTRRQEHINIDDGLGCQSGNCSATNVFDSRRYVAQTASEPFAV